MHRSSQLLALFACTGAGTSARDLAQDNDARQPIEVWRASLSGQKAETALLTAMAARGTERRDALTHFLTDFAAEVAGFVATLIDHARANRAWQPPLNDFMSLGQHGLHLIEKPEFRLSLLAVDAMPPMAPPPIVRFGAGEILFCVASQNTKLHFHQSRRKGDHCITLPRARIGWQDVLHTDLAESSLSVADCPAPAALLRLQIRGARMAERHFCGRTGQEQPHVLGSDAMRRHLALTALSALGRREHVPDTLAAAKDCGDDVLAWHYLRQVFAMDGAAAMPLLTQWATGTRPDLAPLARQTLAVLRGHYPQLAAA